MDISKYKNCFKFALDQSDCTKLVELELLIVYIFVEPASEYVVSIRAFNNHGEGIPRYETVFTSAETGN